MSKQSANSNIINELYQKYIARLLSDRKNKLGLLKGKISTRVICQKYGGKIPKKSIQEQFKATEEYQVSLQDALKSSEEYQNLLNEPEKPTEEEEQFFQENQGTILYMHEKGCCNFSVKQITRYAEELKQKAFEEIRERLAQDVFNFYGVTSFDELCEIANNEAEKEMPENLANHFQNDELVIARTYYGNGYGYWNGVRTEYEDLCANNFQEFLYEYLPCGNASSDWYSYYAENLTENEFIESLGINYAINMIETALQDKDKKTIEEFISYYDDDISEGCYNTFAFSNEGTLRTIFTPEYIESLLRANPNYAEMFKEINAKREQEARLKAQFISQMPKNFVNLYPLARKMQRRFVLHIGPTNSGKTFAAVKEMVKGRNGIYLGPLRLLAFEQYEKINAMGYKCSLVTGEEQILIDDSQFQASTIEMLDPLKEYDTAVIDKGQLINDEFRGGSWTSAVLGICAKEIHICAAPHAEKALIKLIQQCKDTYEIIKHERLAVLKYDEKPFTFPDSVSKGDALIVFSKRSVYTVAATLQKKGISCSVIYGALPYDVRHEESRRFSSGETEVLVATDAIGLGLNLPIKRIVFLETEKYDGKNMRSLLPEEIQQIGGRAGRAGVYETGFYTTDSLQKINGQTVQETMDKNVGTIEKARISFPRALIGIDQPLSAIIRQWDDIPVQDGYEKASCERELALILVLEPYTANKELIYEFVTIPFDESKEDLYHRWFQYFKRHIDGHTIEPYIPSCQGSVHTQSELEDAEKLYAELDLEYQLCRKFGDRSFLQSIYEAKTRLSKKIAAFLKTQKLKGRTCSICGMQLPYGYKYGRCEKCHQKIRNENWRLFNSDFDDLY